MVAGVLSRHGGFVNVDSDLDQPYHPAYAALMAQDGWPPIPAPTGGRGIAEPRSTSAHHLHAISQEASQNAQAVGEKMLAYRRAGARVEALFLGVPQAMSSQGIVNRSLERLADRGQGRLTVQANADESYIGILDLSDRIDRGALVDLVNVYRRGESKPATATRWTTPGTGAARGAGEAHHKKVLWLPSRLLLDGLTSASESFAQDPVRRLGRMNRIKIACLDGLTVLENVMVAEHASRRRMRSDGGSRAQRTAAIHAHVGELLDRLGLSAIADKKPTDLSFGERRFVEISRALASRPKILLMDEPAAGLSFTDRGKLKEILGQVRTSGVTTVLVEHDMRFAMSLGDKATVLAAGKVIFQGKPADAQQSEEVQREYLG